jgi:hypothetical protein
MSTGLGVDLGASDNSRAFLDGRRDRVDLRTAIGDSFCDSACAGLELGILAESLCGVGWDLN